jgi:phosphoesterase RecJ-like protein
MLNQEQQIFEQIKKAKNILIAFNKNWDGDSVASALAVFLFLKKLNKNSEIAAQQLAPKIISDKIFSFLPSFKEIKKDLTGLQQFIISLDTTKIKAEEIKYNKENNKLNFIITPQAGGLFTSENISTEASDYKYDLIITINASDLESLGEIYENNKELFYKTPIINIDRQPSNENFGQINFIEITAVATAEIIFSLFNNFYREALDEDIVTCLLAGMISETKSFKTSLITPQSLLSAAQLISMGARREEIVNNLYRSRPLNVLKLWGRILARLKNSPSGKLAWSTISRLDFIKTDTEENDLNNIIDELIVNMPRVAIIVLIYESEKRTKIIAYAIKNINLLSILKEFSPQGTKNLITLTSDKPYLEAEIEIIRILEEKINKLPL